jgi:peroxiredoxin
MRLFHLTIPIGLALASAGGLLMVSSKRTSDPAVWDGAPRHPVTSEMQEAIDARLEKPAPDCVLPDAQGKSVSLKDLRHEGPVLVYFILDGCPCSDDAEPLFHSLYRHFDGRASFVGITDGDASVAKKWVERTRAPYPILPHPEKSLMKSYGAERSVYCALVRQDGSIERMWAGYSAEMLEEINARIAELLGEEPREFDPQYAPEKLSSGCSFFSED